MLSSPYSMSVMDYPSKVERSSLHSASVHISSITEAAANPEPWQARLEGRNPTSREALNQDYLSPIKLVQLTSEPDLSKVSYLELTINTTENSVGNFGTYTRDRDFHHTSFLVQALTCQTCLSSGSLTAAFLV